MLYIKIVIDNIISSYTGPIILYMNHGGVRAGKAGDHDLNINKTETVRPPEKFNIDTT